MSDGAVQALERPEKIAAWCGVDAPPGVGYGAVGKLATELSLPVVG